MQAIEIQGLTKLYRNGRGVRNVNLEVAPGEVFGFLGPNGAGKTTLLRTVMGFLQPSAGRISILGIDAIGHSREARRKIGFLPSDPALFEFLTGRQNIEFALAMRGVKDRTRMQRLAERMDVDLKRRLKSLSRGNKQKVAIVAALAHDPEVLLLDEPTSGLDPLMQEAFSDLIREEQARGKTVFMSSHVMSEVEQLCDRVGVIRDGEIVTVGGIEDLRKRRLKYVTCQFDGPAPDLSSLAGVTDWHAEGRRAHFTLRGGVAGLIAELAKQPVTDLTLTDPPLEEVFRAFYEGGAAQ